MSTDSGKILKQSYIKIRPVGGTLLYADGQTDINYEAKTLLFRKIA